MSDRHRPGIVARPVPPVLEMAVEFLRTGGLVIAPTDTFYLIVGDAWSQQAVTRLVRLMGRDYGKPFSILAGSRRVTLNFIEEPPPVFLDLAREFWPGPLTMVFRAAGGLPAGITAGTGNIGVRVPAWCVARDLISIYGRPLVACGAGFKEAPPPRSVNEIPAAIRSGVDLILDGGWTAGYHPTTVLNLVPDPPVLLQQGAIGVRVTAFLNQLSWREARFWSRTIRQELEV